MSNEIYDVVVKTMEEYENISEILVPTWMPIEYEDQDVEEY